MAKPYQHAPPPPPTMTHSFWHTMSQLGLLQIVTTESSSKNFSHLDFHDNLLQLLTFLENVAFTKCSKTLLQNENLVPRAPFFHEI